MNRLLRASLLVLFMSVAVPEVGAQQSPATAPARPLNVLFIAVDDLRTTIGAYGDPIAIAPNIDRLAARGMVFDRAYCQQAVCSPSRQSLLTGRRPDTLKVWNLTTHFRSTTTGVVTLPEHFKNSGYFAQSFGKIFHGEAPMADPPSWSVPETYEYGARAEDYQQPQNRKGTGKHEALEVTDAPDEAYLDGKIAAGAIDALRKMGDKPFFLAVGFRKPHLPFTTPKKYWDLYDDKAVGPPPVPMASPSIPAIHLHDSVELRGYSDIPDTGPIAPEQAIALRRGYYACVSFVDAQIGRVVDELDRLKLTDHTIIVLWSDHGFHLGERGLWTKTTNFEIDTRVPLIVLTPTLKKPGHTTALVELVDLYPTLTELCGLAAPDGLEGASLAPLLDDPNRPWKSAVFSQFPRPWRIRGGADNMGYSVRTDRYRYVEWQETATGRVIAQELYDHSVDALEQENLAQDPKQKDVLMALSQVLRDGWKKALPPKSE